MAGVGAISMTSAKTLPSSLEGDLAGWRAGWKEQVGRRLRKMTWTKTGRSNLASRRDSEGRDRGGQIVFRHGGMEGGSLDWAA